MKRTLAMLLAVLALTLGTFMTASAHNLEVSHPHTGETKNEVWVGGDTVPEPAQDAGPMFGPFSLPPSHDKGLPNACEGSSSSPSADFQAPPFGSCEHGVQP